MEKYSNEVSHALQNVGITLLDGCIRDLNIKVSKTKKVKIIQQYLLTAYYMLEGVLNENCGCDATHSYSCANAELEEAIKAQLELEESMSEAIKGLLEKVGIKK